MRSRSFVRKIYDFYRDGFASMETGRVLWAVVIVKLFIIFAVLKLFFFPDVLHEKAERGCEAEYVSSQLIDTNE